MNADHDDDQGLSTALRDRLDDIRPDLDRLVAVATRQGTRIRRRTRLAVSVGTVTCAAAVTAAVALGSSWAGSDPSGAPSRAGFADEPSSSSPPASPTPSAIVTTPSAPAQTRGRRRRGRRSPWTCPAGAVRRPGTRSSSAARAAARWW